MLLVLALALLSSGPSEDELAATITARELEAHVRFLASDLLEGRESGQRGGAIAAAYIASQFAQLGLAPGGNDGYYQAFTLDPGEGDQSAESRTALNVIGVLAGSDPLHKSEYVVLGAHYDHIGVRDGQVCNGADDNASGTAGVLEVAEALSLGRTAPPRSILFIAFAAEEKGLLGSHYFVTHSTVAKSALKAMLNIDMIGRNKPGWVQAVAGDSGPEIRPLLWAAAEKEHLHIDDQMKILFAASDHGSFYREGIPALFLWTTLHSDHHQPSDDVEKIDFVKMRSVARLAMRTLLGMASLPGEFHFAAIDEGSLPRLRFD
jgi:Zn-dependent M28 family amino/carboxypeptidase